MVKKSIWAVLCAFILLWPLAGSSGAAEIESWAPAAKVTVYKGRALVERVGEADLPPGDHNLIIKGLPPTLNERSLKFSGQGPAGAKIAGLEVNKTFLSDPHHPEIVRIKAELDELGRKDHEDNEALKGIGASEKLLDSIAAGLSRQTADQAKAGALNLKGLKSLTGYLREERSALSSSRLDIKERLKRRKGEIEALEKRLAELVSIAGKETREVVVNVSSPSAGGFSFTLTYLVSGAHWRPSYIVRKEGDRVTLDYFGEVSQATGEDWRGVELSLSTARPALGAKPPSPPPWHLDIVEPRKKRMDFGLMKGAEAPPAAAVIEEAEEVEETPAAPEFTETTALFRVPGRHDLASKKGFSRFLVTRLVLPAELTYVIRPEMRPYAYLVAQVVNSSSYPILGGEVQTFVGPDFVGRARLKTAPRGAKFDVGFGVDQEVKVKRKTVRDFKAKKLFGGRIQKILAIEIEIENHKESPLQSKIEERLPVSRDERIKVEVTNALPEPKIDLKEGRLTWERTIREKQKDKISYELTITYPGGVPVSGL